VGANSFLRRAAKRIIHPLVPEPAYRLFQAGAKACDIRNGRWSEPELDLVRLGAREGDTVLDIGANFGLYCYHFSRAVGDSGRVLAFEPIRETSATLGLVVRLLRLSNVQVFPLGVADETGRIAFEVPLQSSGALAAGQAYVGLRDDDHAGRELQVRWTSTKRVQGDVVRLDDFLPDLSNLSFIKCDIEGAELFAFRGGAITITRHLPSVICEINPWFLEGFGIDAEALTGFFLERGYRLYRYVEGRLRLQSPSDIVEDNYVFLHPSRIDALAPLLERESL
jgi:FkbM family methyltransferase